MISRNHPDVNWFYEELDKVSTPRTLTILNSEDIRDLCLKNGADDVGFVEIDRTALGGQKEGILEAFPLTRSIISLAFKLNREPLRTSCHSLTSLEFAHVWEHANSSARQLVKHLQAMGVAALNLSAGFPYEVDRWPGNTFIASDKPIAVEAGLGKMGLNRLVLHPVFGSNIVLCTILVAADFSQYSIGIEYNPCIRCKLCVVACPVGAIKADGTFDFKPCFAHNYRERSAGFLDWVRYLTDSQSFKDYRQRVTDAETISMWQNLSICPQTRCDRCVAVCPAGKENIGEYLTDTRQYLDRTVKKMRAKKETVYVMPDSEAESFVKTRFPHKTAKRIGS
jgi:epoxyqueuosine reductase QueG